MDLPMEFSDLKKKKLRVADELLDEGSDAMYSNILKARSAGRIDGGALAKLKALAAGVDPSAAVEAVEKRPSALLKVLRAVK